jgi:hypothetical protein
MAKKTSRFGANVTADVERRKREGSSYGYLKLPQGVNIYNVTKDGKYKLDIIPYMVTDEHHMDANPKYPDTANVGNPWYKKPFYAHRSVGAEKQSIICPKTVGKKCPICEARAKQQQQGVEKDDLIPKPSLRNLYVVIPIGHKEYDEKMHIWDISNALFQKQLDEELQENPENGSFPDPTSGKTLEVRFKEETFAKNKYYETSRIDFEDRDGYEDEIMEQAPNLDEVLTILSYKEIENIFLELGDDAEEVEEDKPKSKKKPAKEEEGEESEEEDTSSLRKKKSIEKEPAGNPFKKKKPAPVEEEEESEEEEEAPPVKKKAPAENPFKRSPAPVKKKVVEEEEEQTEEEEEDEPAPPKRKVKEEEPKKKVSNSSDESCPAGHSYGKDWDGYDSCDDCAVFEACGKAHTKK